MSASTPKKPNGTKAMLAAIREKAASSTNKIALLRATIEGLRDLIADERTAEQRAKAEAKSAKRASAPTSRRASSTKRTPAKRATSPAKRATSSRRRAAAPEATATEAAPAA